MVYNIISQSYTLCSQLSENFMNEPTYIKSELATVASEELKKVINEDLQIIDPEELDTLAHLITKAQDENTK